MLSRVPGVVGLVINIYLDERAGREDRDTARDDPGLEGGSEDYFFLGDKQ